jgi:hypothetical protein
MRDTIVVPILSAVKASKVVESRLTAPRPVPGVPPVE